MEISSLEMPIDYSNYDLILLAVAHKEFVEFDYNQLAKYNNITIIDAANLLMKENLKDFSPTLIRIGDGEHNSV